MNELIEASERAWRALNNMLEFRIVKDEDRRTAIRDIAEELGNALAKVKKKEKL